MFTSLLIVFFIFSGFIGFSVLNNGQRLYVCNPFIPVLYFGIGSYLVIFLFPVLQTFLSPLSASIAALAFIVSFILYALTRKFGTRPSVFLDKHGNKNVFTRLEYPFLIGKGAEIFFQQVCFAALVVTLTTELSVIIVSVLVAGIMLVMHVPLFLTHGIRWGSLYTLLGGTFGLLLPTLLLSGPNGLAYGFALHLLVYVVSGCLVWIVQLRNTNVA